jgi:L-2,4-diaminobutyrate decarboxylase
MTQLKQSFKPSQGLYQALDLLIDTPQSKQALPVDCPAVGLGESATLSLLAPHVLAGAARLDTPDSMAHMDPPTGWITWATTQWNARLNQNLLHPATAPFAISAEQMVMDWLTPYFGMDGGHMCSGSTLANLTALWAARDAKNIKKVIACNAAHLSIKKAAKLLNMPYQQVNSLDAASLEGICLDEVCLVVTAGTTATGQIDSLSQAGLAGWTHVDAAWAGPLRLSAKHAYLLDGIDKADSVAVSAHKWLFQPKDSALVMFKDSHMANQAISFGGGYLTQPNVGVQGSRGAAAIPLLATIIAWGIDGLSERIELCMSNAKLLADKITNQPDLELLATPTTGVMLFRPKEGSTESFYQRLPQGMLSMCVYQQQTWIRCVAANPLADIEQILAAIKKSLKQLP